MMMMRMEDEHDEDADNEYDDDEGDGDAGWRIGGVAVASDATFPAQLVGWPDLAGLAYLCASTACTPNSWPLAAQLVGWPDLAGLAYLCASTGWLTWIWLDFCGHIQHSFENS